MKFGVCFLVIAAFALNGSAQKMMKLNDALKTNSEPMPVKMRGGSMMKYDFGEYKTILAKAGWNSSKSGRSRGIEESESKQKASIELKGNSNDTCFINISLNETSESIRERVVSLSKNRVAWEREQEPSKVSKLTNIVATITTSADTSTWNFVYVVKMSNQGAEQNYSSGFLTDGTQKIEIKSIRVWDNGKTPTFYSEVGYEFDLDGVVIAAVQNPMDTLQKKFVWLKNGLDARTKLILAAAAAIVLTFHNQTPA